MTDTTYPRDLVGYGRNPPHPRWPNEARVCVQFVVNYEEGGENNILHGDRASEAFLSEIVGAAPWPGQRHMNMESIYEYGSRAGFWRLWRMFTERNMPVTVFGVATAMQRHPEAVAAMREAGWEIASHGLKWIDYKDFTSDEERAHIAEAIRIHTEVAGERPLGFYQGRTSEHTLRLTFEEGGFLYSADSYADELPYWAEGPQGPQLVVPYTLDANDMRFATPQGFNAGDQFFAYLKDTFDVLYAEGETAPKMMSVGLHCRLVGRPGRAAALARFLDYVASHERVWVARRLDYRAALAETSPARGAAPEPDDAGAVRRALRRHLRALALDRGSHPCGGSHDRAGQRGGLARRHGERAGGRHARAEAGPDPRPSRSRRPPEARRSHGGFAKRAGLGRPRQPERGGARPLPGAQRPLQGEVRLSLHHGREGRTKGEILEAFEQRLENDPEQEFMAAVVQIELIALLRLKDRLPSLADVFANLA
jgi:putative urate catabolism protein